MKLKTYIVILLLTLTSCSTSKKSIFKEKEKTEITNDSIIKTEVSKAINDKLNISVPKSNTNDKYKDSIINAKVDQILSNLNTSKQSGNNSYSLYYNLEKRLIELQTKIGETKNESSNINSKESSESKVENEVKTIIKRIPLWLWIIGFLLLLPNIIKAITLIINPLNILVNKIKQK